MREALVLAHRGRVEAVAADGLLHPVALVALVTLLLNDHVLKANAPSPLTGILSGLAGIVIFPLVIQAGWEMLVTARGRWTGPSRRSLVVASIATGIGYTAVELVPPATEAYRFGLGALQWPTSATVALLSSGSLRPVVPVLAVSDPLDLLALTALIFPWWMSRERHRCDVFQP